MAVIRADKFLSELGLASRREAREIIRAGRLRSDGRCVASPDEKLDPDAQTVTLDGELLRYRKYRYFMMDKPAGVLTATEDARQKTVLDLLPPELQRLDLFPVGRLDKDTSGLLLLTNDGIFAHRVISPKSGVQKRYYAEVEGEPDAEDARAFAEGLTLGDGTKCLPALLEPAGAGACYVTVMEGKYHQVKRMLASRGKPVLRLRRLSVGELLLEADLGPGGWRELDENDLCKVLKPDLLEK